MSRLLASLKHYILIPEDTMAPANLLLNIMVTPPSRAPGISSNFHLYHRCFQIFSAPILESWVVTPCRVVPTTFEARSSFPALKN